MGACQSAPIIEASSRSTFPSPLRSAAGFQLAAPGVEPQAAPNAETSRMFTFPWKRRSGFLEAMQLVAPVELLTKQLVAIVRNPKTIVAWLLLGKVTLMGMVREKSVLPVVELVTRSVIIPVRVLAVVSTVRVAEMEAVMLSNDTVLENVIVWVVA